MTHSMPQEAQTDVAAPSSGTGFYLAKALALRQQNLLAEAEAAYRQALDSSPNHAEAGNGLGITLIRLGRIDEAIIAFRSATDFAPNYPEAWNNLGNALDDIGDSAAAVHAFRTAIQLRPAYLKAYNGLARALLRLNNWGEAEGVLRRVVEIWPDDDDATYGLGIALNQQGRLGEALAILKAAVTRAPKRADIHRELGDILQQHHQLIAAEEAYRTAIALRPDYAEAYVSLGSMLGVLGRIDESVALLRSASTISPALPEAHVNLGAILVVKGEPGAAETSLRQALALKPNDTSALSNLASALFLQERLDEAEAAWRALLALSPSEAHAHTALGETLLAQGKLREGWTELEWRWRSEMKFLQARNFAQPEWQGEALNGKTILLYGEQGLGDVLQFVRFAPIVAARGGRVILEVFGPVARLCESVSGVVQVVKAGDQLPPFDVHLPLMSIPRILETTLDAIPAQIPYLHANTEPILRWAKRLMFRDGLRVGLVWSGDPRKHDMRANTVDGRRSMSFARMAPLLDVPDVTFISLQKGAAADELAAFPASRRPIDFMEEVTDFADTAALVANLDLVITVDTSVAHLAGAIGKPVWILSRFAGCWRWLLDRDDSPWYPTARLFRQKAPGDWEEVIARVAEELRKYAASSVHKG